MREETIDQLLAVVHYTKVRVDGGSVVNTAYQDAVKQVAQKYNVTYQTIGDGCRRRLGLDTIEDFKKMLSEAIQGNSSRLKELYIRHAPNEYRSRIETAFANIARIHGTDISSKTISQEPLTTFSIRLSRSESDMLKALALLEQTQPEEILKEMVVASIKDRLKRATDSL